MRGYGMAVSRTSAHRRYGATCAAALILLFSILSTPPLGAQKTAPRPDDPCALVRSILESVPGLTLTFDSLARVEDNDCLPKSTSVRRIGYSGKVSLRIRGQAAHDFVVASLGDLGWKPLLRCDADGPDGTRQALVSGCHTIVVEAEWDGGDDGDPTYVPDDFYRLTVHCASSGLTCP